jgi:ubiquinol-cytochrome c reductase iron-sulfur subunit
MPGAWKEEEGPMKLWQWLVVLFALLTRRRRHVGVTEAAGDGEGSGRIVPAGSPQRRAENLVLAFLAGAVVCAAGFIFTYIIFSPADMPNALLGLSLGLCLVFIALAFTVVAKRLVVTEELEDDYPEASPEAQDEIAQMVRESGSRFTRKRVLLGASALTGTALGAAALLPVLSLGPFWDTAPLEETPWRRGVRVVDQDGNPFLAAEIDMRTFYTGFAEGANMDDIGSPVVIIRLDPAKLRLPPGRHGWAPHGILAYSKICTHAGCAVALYRKPTVPGLEPNNALVCPCHYSTFDPYTGATVIYGPAGRPLPQLPLTIDAADHLRAAGNFSARVGPGWWAVRDKPSSE